MNVEPDHPAFAGHFPGQPMLPAVVVLAEVLAAIERHFGEPPQQWTIAAAKFAVPAEPGDSLTISHTTTPSGTVRFEVRSARGFVASGELKRRHGP